MRYTVLSALAIATLLFGCVSEKDASDVILLLDQSTYTVTEGDLVRFGIETWTINDRLDRLEISSYDRVNGKSELDTIHLGSVRYVGEYLYRAPETDTDSLVVELTFISYDNTSHSAQVHTYLNVINKDALLAESATSVLMYSPASGKPDGFSLHALQPVYVSSADDADIDIYVPASAEPDRLSDEWKSKSGLKFVKMSGVDYSTITRDRLWALYSNAIKSDVVKNIGTGDVIVVGTDYAAAGIILVTGVFDEDGAGNDRYMFNVKML